MTEKNRTVSNQKMIKQDSPASIENIEKEIGKNVATEKIRKNKAKKKNPKTNKKKASSSASSKSVETMFRNAYRAQLDMISLAATKANIMISLNGVIVSILMVTGGFIYAQTPELLLPAILLLITSAISIYFALSAASPSPAPAHTRVFCCFRDVLKRKASLKDFKDYVRVPEKRFNKDNSNILIFEDFASLPKEKYIQYMSELINNPDKVYEKMSDQLYWLGSMADKKFTNLRYSYTVFRWGLILSILVFVGIKAAQHFYHHPHKIANQESVDEQIHTFDNIYEPSGIQQLADGRLVIVEDEPEYPIHILESKKNGQMFENQALTMQLQMAFNRKLDDLEAITLGPDGYLYAISSHKRNKKGKRKADRELLIRFKIEGNKLVDTGIVTNLYQSIADSGLLGDVDKQGKGGLYNLNIEAISFNRKHSLMIGLRNPQIKGKSIILLLKNPRDIFTKKATPVFAKQPILLDLHGGGFRAISYNKQLRRYLITNEIYTSQRNNVKHSQLLAWDGKPGHQPQPIKLNVLLNTNNLEGITTVSVNNQDNIMLVSDNGDMQQNRPANYLLLDYQKLINN